MYLTLIRTPLHTLPHSTEEIFAALEENIVTLSTMKASKYFVVFESEISHWEKTLSHISETIEMLLQVRLPQRLHGGLSYGLGDAHAHAFC